MSVTIKLTDREARLLWGIVDGAADAGSCEEGLTEEEHKACHKFLEPISAKMLKDRNFGKEPTK